jgi:very-short-patch-repair endonuclease
MVRMENAPHISVAGDPKHAPRLSGRAEDGVALDRRVAALAGRQHGVVARWQLLGLGMTEQMVKSRLKRGALNRIHRGVFATGHRATTVEGRWMAATLAFGPDAVLSHRSAGQLWGIVPRSRIRPEVTRPRHAAGRPYLVVHQAALPTDEVVRRWGIPVTCVPRTILDLAATRSEREVERAWNEMEVRGYTHSLSVPDLLERYPGRRGSVVLARLASGEILPVGITRNDFEEAFLALIDRHGLPRPRMNHHVALRGRFYEVDCFWEEQRVAIELDGGAVHKTLKAFEDDRERDRILSAEGFTANRITWRQLHDKAQEVADDLRKILTPYPSSNGSGALRPLSPR